MVSNWFFLPVVVGMLLLVSCVQAAPVTNGLVAYYDGNLSVDSLVDLSGNNNTGYATHVTPGINQLTGANYINLNGVNSKIDVSNNAQTNVSSPISIEFIGSINEFKQYGAIVSKYKNGVTGWYLSSSSASPYNHARFAAGAGGVFKNYESDASLTAGQVYDIVVTYDNNTTHIYINGTDSGSRLWNLPIIGSPENITIGYGSSSGGLKNSNCSMYTFRLYNRSLSSSEVLQNYNNDLWRYTTKATPTITWSNPADITYGIALSSTQLNAVATNPKTGNTVTGSFVYNPPAGTVLSVGTYTLHVDFTPTDTANYTNATANVTINVIENPVPPVANFSYARINYPPLTVQFTDTSTNGANYQWNFRDGSSNVTLANPLHTFASPGVYSVQETVSNAVGSSTKTQNVDVQYPNDNIDVDELQLWTFDASKVSDVPNNIYTTTYNLGKTSNVSLTYNSTLDSVDSMCWNNDSGETYITGAYPAVNQNLTFTMGIDSSSQSSYGYLHTSVAYIGVRHALDGSYWIYSYWTNDTGSRLSSSYQIPATSVVNNRVTVSIHSYDSNRTNVVTSGPTLYVTTPYTTRTTRNLPYTNVIQPLIYVDLWASGIGGWVNVHLYNITQSIPRNIITPYARNDIMAFGLDCPNTTNDKKGTDFLILHNQTATVFVEGGGAYQSDLLYNKNLFAHGFEEAIHFFPGFTPLDLAEAESIIDEQTQSFNSIFGALPTSWAVHQNEDNVSHATYAYNKYGMLYRNGCQGMGYIPNAVNLQNSTWDWWNISSARGAISPCFTHQTDIYPAPKYAIDPDLFETFVTNLNSNGIDLVSFLEWYYSSMAQNATISVLEHDENHLKFQLNTNGGYPVNMNVQTVISPSYLYCNDASIPFEQTSDGIQFMSAGNGTYILTPLTIPLITWNTPADITAGTAVSNTQLNAVATNPKTGNTVTGSFVYNPPAGTVLSAGTHTLHVDFTPNDDENYTIASKDVTINVLGNLPIANFTASPMSGLAPLSVKFTDTSTGSPASWKWNFGDDQTSTAQNPSHTYSTAGTYTVSLNVSNANGSNILAKPNLITVIVPPPNGLVVYYDGNLSGNSLVDLSGNNNIGYTMNVTSGTNQLTDANYINFNGASSKVDIANNAQTNVSSPISIEFIGSVNNFTQYGALVSKYDDRNITGWYTGCSAHLPYQQVRFALCMWNATSGTTFLDGDKSIDWLVAGQVYHIVVTYDNSTARIYINGVNSGNHIWSLPIVGNSKNITIGSGSGIPNGNCSMYVFRLYNRVLSPDDVWQNYIRDRPIYMVTPTITWSNPADINYGTALSEAQLNAVATNPVTGNTVTGSFVYTPASGAVLNVGTHTLHVDFTPTDTANYTNATADVTINVLEKSDDTTQIKKLVYGDGGLPRYMGSHAMSQSGPGMSLVNSDMSSLGLVSTPYYQDNGGSNTSYTLLNSSISGVKWKNYYAPGSSASLLFYGNNRTRLESIDLSNNSLHLSNSVTYAEETLVTKEAVPVTGNAFQFYGDGLNTISGDTVQVYTDNGLIQSDCLLPEGEEVYSYYQNRTAGTTRNNSIELPLFSPQLTPMPCPSGYLGSLSFAIHADSQDPESLKTMIYGTNDPQNPVYGKKGYLGHGLICTWSAFALSTNSGAGIDNPLFKSTIDEMYDHGFEIVPHNVVAWMGEGYPTRAVTAYYLPWYYNNYSTRNWIDHGLGHGNRCTSLKRLGLDKTSEYYIGDLLRQYEIQYAWAYQDRKAYTSGGLSTSKNQSLGLPYDIVWTNTNFTWDDGTPMYEWASTYGADAGSLNYFKNDTLQTMINNHGVCFWHDYTAMNTTTFENYYYTKGNPYMINETYDNLLQNISEQKTAGRLWNPTVSQYIDYWRAACNVECKCTGQNAYTLINHNSATINGYAMRVTGSYTVRLDGTELNPKTNGADTIFWMNLSPGEHLLTLAEA